MFNLVIVHFRFLFPFVKGKGKHIRRPVNAAVSAVEFMDCSVIDKGNIHFCLRGQGLQFRNDIHGFGQVRFQRFRNGDLFLVIFECDDHSRPFLSF